MPTREDDFKARFAAVLSDLKDDGRADPEAMYLLGDLAMQMADRGGVKTWSALKAALSQEAYASLLATFQQQGNAVTRQGKAKVAYAMQALAVSLVARTQTDPQLEAGDKLLDALIDQAIGVRREAAAAKPARH